MYARKTSKLRYMLTFAMYLDAHYMASKWAINRRGGGSLRIHTTFDSLLFLSVARLVE
jgi:hypothetical protein